MSSVGSVGAANAQMMQQIAQLNKVLADAVTQQTGLSTELVKLSLTQATENQRLATTSAALDQVI